MKTTDAVATSAEATSGCTTRSGRFCSSSTSSTSAPRIDPRRVPPSPSGESGMSRRTSDGAGRGELPQRGIVSAEALEIAERRAGQREQPHADDGGRQVQQERLLARADDEPRAHREERDGGRLGQQARRGARPEAAQRRHRAPQHVGGCRSGRHARTSLRVEVHDRVGDRARGGAVRDQQHGRAAVGELAQIRPQRGLGRRVEGGARLVERDHGGAPGEVAVDRARDRHPLRLSARESRALHAECGLRVELVGGRQGERLRRPARAGERHRRARRSRRSCPRSVPAAVPTTRARSRVRASRHPHRRTSRCRSTPRRRGAPRTGSTCPRRSDPR